MDGSRMKERMMYDRDSGFLGIRAFYPFGVEGPLGTYKG